MSLFEWSVLGLGVAIWWTLLGVPMRLEALFKGMGAFAKQMDDRQAKIIRELEGISRELDQLNRHRNRDADDD